MRCPFCKSSENRVIDKRETENLEISRRRRECASCKKRFTTYERVEYLNLTVVKKDKRREQYDREKLKRGILKACEKLPITNERIEKILDSIEAELKKCQSTEVKSTALGSLVMKHLKKLNKVAYIRFASVYREFADLSTFEEEVQKLLKKERHQKIYK